MKVTYLEHSGFVIEDGRRAYVFDYWKDPAGVIDTLVAQGYELHVFVSHIHHDHYVKSIFKYLPYIHSVGTMKMCQLCEIFSRNCRRQQGLSKMLRKLVWC